MKRELLRMDGITFGEYGQRSLSDFNLVLHEGETLGVFSTHAVVKNALVGLIAGRLGAQHGRLYLEDEPSPFEESDRHRRCKVGVVNSVKTLVDDLTVSDNIFVMRRGFRSMVIDKRLLHAQTRQLMSEFNLTMTPEALVRNLSGVERCNLEIAKAVALGARIVILQDVSSFLSDVEIGQLLAQTSLFKRKGVGFLMVDGSVQLLADYADRVSIIKNGRNFWTFSRGEVNERVMKICFSRENAENSPDDSAEPARHGFDESDALVFDRVSAAGLEPLSFTLRKGEELCIFDQEGKSVEVIRALLGGERAVEGGRIRVDGKPFTARNAWEALDQKVAFVVENPADTMLVPDLSAIENLCLPSSAKTRDFWINPVYLKSCKKEYGAYFGPDVLERYPDALSAQDRHKLVYCRWHLYKPEVVVCIKPFSSVDKSLEEISAFFIAQLLKKGIAVLILTSTASETGLSCKKMVINQKNALLHPKDAL